jgi:hypothetical protein
MFRPPRPTSQSRAKGGDKGTQYKRIGFASVVSAEGAGIHPRTPVADYPHPGRKTDVSDAQWLGSCPSGPQTQILTYVFLLLDDHYPLRPCDEDLIGVNFDAVVNELPCLSFVTILRQSILSRCRKGPLDVTAFQYSDYCGLPIAHRLWSHAYQSGLVFGIRRHK